MGAGLDRRGSVKYIRKETAGRQARSHDGVYRDHHLRQRVQRHRSAIVSVAPARLEAPVVQRDRALPKGRARAPLPGRARPRRHDRAAGSHPRRRGARPGRLRGWHTVPVLLGCGPSQGLGRPPRPTHSYLRGDPRCPRHRPHRRRKAPRRLPLRERPRDPLGQGQRLRQLPRRARRGRRRTSPSRGKVVELRLRAWAHTRRCLESSRRSILRSGPTTPSCVRCRQCSIQRSRSRRGSSCRARRAQGYSAEPRSGARICRLCCSRR